MGVVQTAGIKVQCDQKHGLFLTRLFTSFFEDGKTYERFVPYSLLYGDDPVNHRSYRTAIIVHNKYLEEVRVLPVIGISPKALLEKIQVGSDPAPVTVLEILNRYSHFSSIEATPQSEAIGKYFFLTTRPQFEQAKVFITETLPQLWAKLDNNFLTEPPR